MKKFLTRKSLETFGGYLFGASAGILGINVLVFMWVSTKAAILTKVGVTGALISLGIGLTLSLTEKD